MTTEISSPEDFRREFEKLKKTKMNIHNKIDVDEYYSANERDKRAKAKARIYADIRACLIATVIVLSLLVLTVLSFSHLMAKGEGYYNQSISKEYMPEECYKLKFADTDNGRMLARKLGCL